MDKGVSVVVCCYNSAQNLPQTLRHLTLQKISEDVGYEIVIVDNASTDDTKLVALRLWAELGSHINFKIVEEKQPGLSSARRTGVKEAHYEFITFCDDDNWLEENYISEVFRILSSDQSIGAVGGRSEAVSDIPVPDWFEEHKHSYAVGEQASHSGDISQRMFLWGAGLSFRKSLFITAFEKYPSILSDRKGSELTSGGDSELCMRIIMLGYRLFYSNSLKFTHFIQGSRLSKDYREKLYKGFDEAIDILDRYKIIIRQLGKKKLFVAFKSLIIILQIKLFSTNRDLQYEYKKIYYLTGWKLSSFTTADYNIRLLYLHFIFLKKTLINK